MPQLSPNKTAVSPRWLAWGAATLVVTSATALGGCRRDAAARGEAAASASASARTVPNALPIPTAQVAAAVNPGNLPAYSGPTGAVAGKITVKGPPPPRRDGPRPDEVRCGKEAVELHDKLFRVGPAGELADAIVGATGYNAYVPPREEAVELTIRGCAFNRRTAVLTFGQRLEIKNLDTRETYLPHLDGARAPALMAAMPGGDAVRIYPPKIGVYSLADDLKHPWMHVEVFVFKFSTFDVSGADGSFKIDRLPVGKVKLSVRHPDIGQTVERMVEISADKTTEASFEITYEPPAPSAPAASRDRMPEIH